MEPRYDEYGSRDTSQPYAAFLVAVDDELSAHAAVDNKDWKASAAGRHRELNDNGDMRSKETATHSKQALQGE
ncbi:hypothetical protein HA49_06630 [Tatumella morbirosei]|uniref:Uncharacterized protein n=1 Tax=Tatumella morbirosei TaxID=642227 RepID=A0A095VK10_9GAMM|nr:hypothetical protein [Tatumella morbirosei]KGD74955.1 hypothetical protein HA49_06630 [Tatumella morbirosei]